jgi:hypothetical protein
MRRFAAALLVVTVFLVLADRGAAVMAGRVVRAELADRGAVGARAEVLGMPFLTQLADRRFEHVSVEARRLSVGGGRLWHLDADVGDVALRSRQSAVAGWLRATAQVPFREAERRVGLPAGSLSQDEDGLVRFQGPVSVLGVTVSVVATARVSLSDNSLLLTPEEISLSRVPGASARLLGPIRQALSLRIPVPGLPPQLHLNRVRVEPMGLRIDMSGRDVPLGKGGV